MPGWLSPFSPTYASPIAPTTVALVPFLCRLVVIARPHTGRRYCRQHELSPNGNSIFAALFAERRQRRQQRKIMRIEIIVDNTRLIYTASVPLCVYASRSMPSETTVTFGRRRIAQMNIDFVDVFDFRLTMNWTKFPNGNIFYWDSKCINDIEADAHTHTHTPSWAIFPYHFHLLSSCFRLPFIFIVCLNRLFICRCAETKPTTGGREWRDTAMMVVGDDWMRGTESRKENTCAFGVPTSTLACDASNDE